MTSILPAAAAQAQAGEAPPFSVVCLSPQRWDAPLPTNRQQIMCRLAERGHDVLYVHTGEFVGRGLRGRGPAGGALPAPWRVRRLRAPNLAPWGHKLRTAHRVNGSLGARAVARAAASLPRPLVAWVYDPCSTALASRLGADLLVYDCVDDYAEQVGGDRRRRELVLRSERDLVFRADLVFATARPLFDRHRAANAHTFHVRNVGDFRHFAREVPEDELAEEVLALRPPRVGFVGNFLPDKVDLDLIEAAARARRGWSFALIGPAAGQEERLARLARASNVHWLGERPYRDLPRYVAAFDVALIPYRANDYTRSCFPLKLFEYLAAGKPVVASGLPELSGIGPDVALVDGPEELVVAVDSALGRRSAEDVARRRTLAAANSWDTRTARLSELVEAALEALRPAAS